MSTPVPVSFFFDYACPFCYVGSARLQRLANDYPLEISWRFIEIHPENPPEGKPVSELGYDPDQWRAMTESLRRMAEEDRLPLAERTFTTNTRRALVLAQAVLSQRPDRFQGFHNALFHAYFAERMNIGDPAVLRALAEEHGAGDLVDTAWNSSDYLARLLDHVEAARDLGLTGVPTLVVAGRPFVGAVSIDTLAQALAEHRD